MRVRIPDTDLTTYPDVVVVCGEPRFGDETEDVLLNPALLAIGRFRRFVSTLMAAQDEVRVELFERQDDGRWIFSEVRDLDGSVDLSAAGAMLSLKEVYLGVPDI